MCKFAIKTGEAPLRSAMIDVVRIAMAEVIAIATGNGDLDRLSESRAVVILSKVVSYLRRRRKMSVDGATRLCLKVGMGWNGNEPVVNRFVCFFKDFACCSYDEAIRQLFQTEPCHFSDKLDKGLVLNMVHRVMCNDISDASPFQIVSEDFKAHLNSLEEKIRFDLNSFVVSYHDYKNDEVNPACVLAYTLWNLNEIVCGQIKHHLPWVEAVLSGDRKCRGASFMTLNSVSLFELCDYIERGLLGEYAERRKRMGRFKKAFIGKNDMRVANSIIKEMCDDGDRAAARRWNGLVKSLADKDKGTGGLPCLSAKIERLRHDSITWMLVEDLAGYSFVDIVGRCVAKESCL
ncbi:MAG TPA: hypothetical protein PKJ68_06415, partial [Candidatus Woesebacteria bacterium]|nr:hypothetical protein [Candidatus Woesebacteria bacterium]